MSVETAPEPAMLALPVPANGGTDFGNRFLFVAVASQRVLQIRNGSRPRIDLHGHKPAALAVAEVLAGCVPYITP